ncbi:hypothetical protein BU25DRAFT_483025, partial [Macroventuria anomochaeta]
RVHQPPYSCSSQHARTAPRSLHNHQTPSHPTSHATPSAAHNVPLPSRANTPISNPQSDMQRHIID